MSTSKYETLLTTTILKLLKLTPLPIFSTGLVTSFGKVKIKKHGKHLNLAL
jgi:hypothetical protein